MEGQNEKRRRNRRFVHWEPLAHETALHLQHDQIRGPVAGLNPTRATYHHDTSRRKTEHSAKESTADDRQRYTSADHRGIGQEDNDARSAHRGVGSSHRLKDSNADSIQFLWRSRDNRKGRHVLAVPENGRDPDGRRLLIASPGKRQRKREGSSSSSSSSQAQVRQLSSKRASTIINGIVRMCTSFPYWDISYLVAIIFTLGSVVWVINAFFVYLPLAQPATEFQREISYGGGISAFIGATIFEIGSILLMLEAVNENRSGCFGWAVDEIVESIRDAEHGDNLVKLSTSHHCHHHHPNKRNLVGKGSSSTRPTSKDESPVVSTSSPSMGNAIKDHNHENGSSTSASSPSAVPRVETFSSSHAHSPASMASPSSSPSQSKSKNSWQWLPNLADLKSYYLRQLGFLASAAQLFGATIFWISGFTALPGINNRLSQNLLDGIYWTPQIVGGTGFIISGTLFMLETQKRWYLPAWTVLGWHIGLWNLIGAFGFTLSGALGPAYGNSGAEYEAALATFWGSWAFLIGSLIQWYESLDKYPVKITKSSRD